MNAPARSHVADRSPGSAGPRLEVAVARTLDDLMQVVAVRTLVYMGEQSCPFEEEYDGNDFAGATHLILRADGEPAGVMRIRWFGGFAKLERLAIRPEHRGLPALLMLARAGADLAARKGFRLAMGHADERITPFWRRYFRARPRAGRADVVFSGHRYLEFEFDLTPPADAVTLDSDACVLLRPEGAWDRPGVLDRSNTLAARQAPLGELAA